jgi:hypothetical protein
MDDLLKSLPGLLRSVGDAPEVREAAAIAAWKYTAGDGLRDHAVPISLNDRTLVVAVADEAWQKQLQTMTGQMLFRVNSILGQSVVGRIELRINPKLTTMRALPKKTSPVSNNEVPLDLWSAASAIKDKQLRQKFLLAAAGSMKRLSKEKPNGA